ncbi:MAG: alpha/beta hydrolase [Flavipsychrobacter sp.]|nr:alpha/beta hydrolase [Flavipsychrobacter sp.]
MKNIYCISGLGADERIFRNLSIPGARLVHVPWAPYDKHDEVPCYAQKMSERIKEKDPVLLGVSFGGMLAVEIAKQRHIDRAFIISSAKTRNELAAPGTGGLLAALIKSRLVPPAFFTMPNTILLRRFGAGNADERELLTEILEDTDPRFVKWALQALLKWQSESYTEKIVHIHGTGDKIIQSANVQPHIWVEGGSHLMIYNRAAEISKLVTENL